jgi:hypothetical protein
MFVDHQTTAGDLARLFDLVAAISKLRNSAMFVGGCGLLPPTYCP